jgi:phosphoglycolate phosphatase
MPQIKTVLFDLDGTLADTAPDLADALNHVLSINNKPNLKLEAIRQVVSHGGIALIKLGFDIDPSHSDFEPLRQQLLEYYLNNIANKTKLFNGMEQLLLQIEQNNMNWGVVTNKPAWLTDPLMRALKLDTRAICIVSGDTLEERKPHPAPLLHACAIAGSAFDECVYIGDAERDIIAGNKAGMQTIIASFGYIDLNDHLESWNADLIIESPGEIASWLGINTIT